MQIFFFEEFFFEGFFLEKKIVFIYFVHSNCYPDAVAILAFLSDVVRDVKEYAIPTDMPLVHCERLIQDEFTEIFAAEALRHYLLTKKQDTLLYDAGDDRLVSGLIAIKMKNDNLTVAKLQAKAEQLRKSSDELRNKLVATDCDKYFSTMVEHVAEKESEYQKLLDAFGEKRRYLKMITLTHDEKAKTLASKQAKIQELVRQIQHQKYSVIDIKQLLAKEMSIKNSIAMIQTEIEAIKIDAADSQVKLARAHKLKLDAIKKFNDLTFQITRKLVQCHSYANLNVNDLTIDPTASNDDILKICQRVRLLNENCTLVKLDRTKRIQQNATKLTELRVHSNRLSQKYTEQKAICDEASHRLDAANQMHANYQSNGSSAAAKLQRDIADQISIKAKLDDEIVNLQRRAEQLTVENVELFNEAERKGYEIIREKQALCNQMDELNDFIDQCTK